MERVLPSLLLLFMISIHSFYFIIITVSLLSFPSSSTLLSIFFFFFAFFFFYFSPNCFDTTTFDTGIPSFELGPPQLELLVPTPAKGSSTPPQLWNQFPPHTACRARPRKIHHVTIRALHRTFCRKKKKRESVAVSPIDWYCDIPATTPPPSLSVSLSLPPNPPMWGSLK